MATRQRNSSSNSTEVVTEMLSQHAFESAIYKILEYGDESKLAHAIGKSAAYYSQMINPEDPRESIWFRAARDFNTLIDIDPVRGLSVLEVFNFYARKCVAESGEVADAQDCLSTKIRTDARTTAELVEAMHDGTIDERETARILIAISEERRVLDDVEKLLHRRPAVVKMNGRNGHK